MSHHYVIIDNFPKLVENNKFCLESSVLLIVDTFTNIVAYLIKHRYSGSIKALVGVTGVLGDP